MSTKIVERLQSLTDIAEIQGGLFSAAQANEQGISHLELARLFKSRYIEREAWGVYRMSTWPLSPHAGFWRALLWANVGGGNAGPVISHRSALMIHGASLDNPPLIDITLPRSKVRMKRRQTPPAVRVHFADLHEDEITTAEGIPVTTVFRSVVDLLIDREAVDSVTYVLAHGIEDGKISQSEFDRLIPLYDIDPALLQRVLERVRSGA